MAGSGLWRWLFGRTRVRIPLQPHQCCGLHNVLRPLSLTLDISQMGGVPSAGVVPGIEMEMAMIEPVSQRRSESPFLSARLLIGVLGALAVLAVLVPVGSQTVDATATASQWNDCDNGAFGYDSDVYTYTYKNKAWRAHLSQATYSSYTPCTWVQIGQWMDVGYADANCASPYFGGGGSSSRGSAYAQNWRDDWTHSCTNTNYTDGYGNWSNYLVVSDW